MERQTDRRRSGQRAREIWAGRNRIYLRDDGIVHVTVIGNIDEKTAISMREAGIELRNINGGKVNTIMDLNDAGKPSAKARKVMEESCTHINAGKIALFGLHPVAKVIASFTMGLSKKRDIRFFKTEEEALAWLKE